MPTGKESRDSSRPLRLPPDGPLDQAGRERHDEHRLDPVIVTLFGQLADWLGTGTRGRRQTIPPRIGLFGGLGQGKSTVVCNVIERLQQARSGWQRLRDAVLGPRIARFDVSFFKADDLEWRFFTAVLWRRVLRNLVLIGLVLGAELVLVVGLTWAAIAGWNPVACAADPAGCWTWLPGATLAAWAASSALILPLAAWLAGAFSNARDAYQGIDPAGGLYIAQRDRLIKTIARLVPALPDVVVVDDLDRAGVEQQRAFLRALSRFSRELGFALVVCMDESEILTAEPNPEAPEQLLRKTITVELHVPERTREDIAFLAAVCAREFAAANHHPDEPRSLTAALTSVQFVTDLTRTLLLTSAETPAHPREVWRVLVGVAQQARQLGVTGADDLGALMRIEGIYRLAPPLRRRPDALRKTLEANQRQPFDDLIQELDLKPTRSTAVVEFFHRTRMMQPGIADGWFRLLGGFSGSGSGDLEAWCSAWPMQQRSLDFFRLFVEAVELDAAGYAHDLVLEVFDPEVPGQGVPTPQAGFKFSVPGGYIEQFLANELPDAFGRSPDYLAQCWLLWVCVLVTTTEPLHRPPIYRRARRWIFAAPKTQWRNLLDLFWRECLADAGLWGTLDPAQRDDWWDALRRDVREIEGLGIKLVAERRLFGVSLVDSDFADAWSLLCHPTADRTRDGRSALLWWRHLTPQVTEARIAPTGETSLAAEVWPAPRPTAADSRGWCEVLGRHFRALNVINARQRQALMPSALRKAWSLAQAVLSTSDCLDLIFLLAFEPSQAPGQRWGIESTRPWVDPLEDRLDRELRTLLGQPGPGAAGTAVPVQEPAAPATPEQRSALVLVAVLREWPPAGAAALISGIADEVLTELRETLANQGQLPDWL